MKRTVINALTSEAFRAYRAANGTADAQDIRYALMDPAANGNSVHARKSLYAALSATAAGTYPDGGNGSTQAARQEAAQQVLALWPRAWSVEAQAAVDPIFDDRHI